MSSKNTSILDSDSPKNQFSIDSKIAFVDKQQNENLNELLYKQDSNNLYKKKSQIQQKSQNPPMNSSITTIFAIVNMMVGSIVLILPINVQNCGLILSIIIMVVIGIISYITCYWIVKNTRAYENNIGEVIERILDKKWKNLFLISSCLLLGLAGMIYSVLINQTTWQIFNFIAQNFGMNENDVAGNQDIDFTKYSMQWQAIILFPILLPLLFIKKTNFIVKIAGYGSVSLYLYIGFIFFLFFQDLINKTISDNIDELNLFSNNLTVIGAVIGNFTLAFNAHNGITKITSSNKNKSKNTRDFSIAFIIVFLIYAVIGGFGYFGILGRKTANNIQDPQIIYDYFGAKNVLSFTVAFFFLIHLISIYPLLCFISKNQLFFIIYDNQESAPKKYHLIFNLVFAILCLIIQVFLIDINIVIGLAGSAIGYIIVYLVPSIMKLKTSLVYQIDWQQSKSNYIVTKKNINSTQSQEQENYQINTGLLSEDYTDTEVRTKINDGVSIYKKYLFYGLLIILNLIGFTFAVISVLLIFI